MEAVGEIVSDEVTAGLHVAEASVEIAGEPVTDAAVAAQIAAQHAASTAQLHLSTVASDASAAVQMAMAAALAAGGAPVVPGSAPPFALGPQAAAQAASEAEKMANAKRPWTAEEDQLLLEAITKYGTQRWPLIAGYVQRGRAGKQCRERWFNHLSPTVKKGDWTEEEDAIIQQGVAELGTKWSEIVKRLPGRTDNSIKNRYNSQQRREQRRARAAANATGGAAAAASSAEAVVAEVEAAYPQIAQAPDVSGADDEEAAAKRMRLDDGVAVAVSAVAEPEAPDPE